MKDGHSPGGGKGGQLEVLVEASRLSGIAGADVTVSWQAGNLRFLGAEAGNLTGDGWLVQAQQDHKSVRIIALDGRGRGLSDGAGDLLVLRFAAKGRGKGRDALPVLRITVDGLSDAVGNRMLGAVRNADVK